MAIRRFTLQLCLVVLTLTLVSQAQYIVGTLNTNGELSAFATDPQHQRTYATVFVPELQDSYVELLIIDTQILHVVSDINLGTQLGNSMTENPVTQTIYTTQCFNNLPFCNVEVFNSSGTQIASIMVVNNDSLPSLGGIGVNTATNRIYVSNPDNTPEPTVTVIDGNTNQVIDNIAGFGSDEPGTIAVDSVHNRIYVQTNQERIDAIDGAANQIVQSSQSHLYTGALALNPASSLIYASSTANNGNAIAVVDGQDLSQLDTIDVNVSPPGSIALDPNTGQLFTAGYPGRMDVIHTNNNELWTTVPNANGPLAVDDVNHLIWGVGPIPLQGYPQPIAIWHEVGVNPQ